MTRVRSRLTDDRTFLLHGDLHNHSLFSDGDGDPERAFDQMRAAGLDFAALTDHASIPHHSIPSLDPSAYPDADALQRARNAPRSFDDAAWRRTAQLADAADDPGTFTAIRGFEWTEPWVGHANVWFSDSYHDVQDPGCITGFHEWLTTAEPTALFGYNHPGREPGRFGDFTYLPGLAGRMVALEAFNRFDDYLFAEWSPGRCSGLLECLDAGWRPGLIGVSDEHGPSYALRGKGRTGLWVREHSRAGVREALLARRSFAAREVGLCLDATLDGVRMGGELRRDVTSHRLEVDLTVGQEYAGSALQLQVLAAGTGGSPDVLALVEPRDGEPTIVEVESSVRHRWLLVRVADTGRPNAWRGARGHPGNSYAVAYASPWYAPADV